MLYGVAAGRDKINTWFHPYKGFMLKMIFSLSPLAFLGLLKEGALIQISKRRRTCRYIYIYI